MPRLLANTGLKSLKVPQIPGVEKFRLTFEEALSNQSIVDATAGGSARRRQFRRAVILVAIEVDRRQPSRRLPRNNTASMGLTRFPPGIAVRVA
jgi:hypothetical protein